MRSEQLENSCSIYIVLLLKTGMQVMCGKGSVEVCEA